MVDAVEALARVGFFVVRFAVEIVVDMIWIGWDFPYLGKAKQSSGMSSVQKCELSSSRKGRRLVAATERRDKRLARKETRKGSRRWSGRLVHCGVWAFMLVFGAGAAYSDTDQLFTSPEERVERLVQARVMQMEKLADRCPVLAPDIKVAIEPGNITPEQVSGFRARARVIEKTLLPGQECDAPLI